MMTMRTVLYGASCFTVIFAGLRMAMDGENGELITALTLIAGCVLFVGGTIVGRLDRLISTRLKE